jgi:hypothetical protein
MMMTKLLIGASEIMYTHYESIHMPKYGGSVLGIELFVVKANYVIDWKLFEDYFSDDPTYGPEYFRRRFIRTHFNIFFRILPTSSNICRSLV